MNNIHEPALFDGVAIIGMAGRFPGAKDLDAFWQNLCDGREAISFFSDQELLEAGIAAHLLNDPNYVKAGSILEESDLFDAAFFGYTPREAEVLDPQQRVFLECAWEAVEHAGYDPDTYMGRIGVYAGESLNAYLFSHVHANRELLQAVGPWQAAIGNEKDFLPTRVSYKLNLRGPSVNIQAACSTSLVAVHTACQSVLNGECDMALAGGISINVPQKTGYLYQEGGIFSPDGHCRAFDARGQGIICGNGVGIVVLKRLADALTDGDTIHAIIRGTAINNDGAQKIGYTAPSIDGQAQVIAEAQTLAQVDPESITYIEAHGTGTPLGDPIEITALTQVFRSHTDKEGFCALGSVKTNIGHLDAAAGAAGLLKTVLALKHGQIPPSLHFEHPNPKIDFTHSPFYVNTRLTRWETGTMPRRAGVSSFGIGGTNAHVVLEEAPRAVSLPPSRPNHLLVLSAKTSSALEMKTRQLMDHLKKHPELNIADVAYTLQVGRKAFPYRCAFVCQDTQDAINALEQEGQQRVHSATSPAEQPQVVFLFPGQGTQHIGMAAELYQHDAFFREQVDLCARLLTPSLGFDIREVLYPTQEASDDAAYRLGQTALTQPALFVIEYALARLWMAWGIQPQAMLGHSIGEYVAACLAGVFSLEDALTLVAARGQMMQQMPTGAMLSVPLSEIELTALLGEQLSLAAINTPNRCVVSGPQDAIETLEQRLGRIHITCRRLHTSHAFHSQMISPIMDSFRKVVAQVELHPPTIPCVSNVTGTWLTSEEATNPDYWSRQLRQPVRFADGMNELWKNPEPIFLEVGPGRTLSSFALEHPASKGGRNRVVLSSLPHVHEKRSDDAFLLNTLAGLCLAGQSIAWTQMHAYEQRHRLPLPTYPFERQRYWASPQPKNASMRRATTTNKINDIADWFYLPSWKRSSLPASSATDMLEPSPVLIFADEYGIASHLRQRLEQSGHPVICILAGTAFTCKEEQVYTINPSQPSDYDRLVQELLSQPSFPTTIAHSWLVSADDEGMAGDTAIEKILERGFYSLFFLVQALDRAFVTTPLHIEVVSNALQAVTGNETLCPAKATVLALCTVIAQEYPHIQCSSIDIELPQIGNWQHRKLTEQLVRELTLRPTDRVVAYRGQYRWVQTFEPFPLLHPTQPSIQLREGGVFMITGGVGDIGLVQAHYLARHLKAKLVLVGRSAFPERDTWTHWLHTHDEQDFTSVRIRTIMEMEALGAEVLLCQADVACREQMQKVLRQVHERFGHLNGVIHSAGIIGGVGFHILREANKAECEMHFQSKVYGLSILRELLQDVELDFCLLQSSLSSILGGVGCAAYAAANCFMDAVAYQQNLQGPTPWISINWDSWQSAATHTHISEHVTHVIQATSNITQKSGEEAFARILSMEPVPQIITSTVDLQAIIDRSTVTAKAQQRDPAQENALSPHSRAPQTGTYIAPRTATERAITDIWQSLLGIEPIGIHDNFFDLGGHSVSAIQVVARIRMAYSIELGIHMLFENPTIAALGEIMERMSNSQQAQKPILTPISRTHYRAEESSASSKQEFFKEKGQGEL